MDLKPSWTESYVGFLASFTDAPEVYSRFMAWSVLGATLAGKCTPISIAADDLRPNFWVILVGPSGEARKSTQLKVARRMARKADDKLPAPQGGSYVGVLEHLQKNPNIFFVFDEFKRFMEWMNNEYNREAKSFFTEIYDWPWDEEWVATRAAGRGSYSGQTNSIRIKGPCVSMAIGSTEAWLTSAVGRSDLVSGFLPRYLMIPYPGKTKSFSYPPDRDKNWENSLTQTLRAAAKVNFRYKVKSEAREAYQVWYDEMRASPTFQQSITLQPYFHRMTVYAWKICMVESVARIITQEGGLSDSWGLDGQKMEQEVTIDAEIMKTATEAITSTLDPLADMFEDSLAKGKYQEQRRDIIEVLKAVAEQHGFISHSALMRRVKIDKRDLKAVVDGLTDERRLIQAQHLTGKRGRVPVMYRLLRRGEDYDERMLAAMKYWDKRDKG
jgi:hypothetical protein